MKLKGTQELSHFFGLAAALFLVWLLLSGKLEPKYILFGVVASLATSFICMPFLTVPSVDKKTQFFLLRGNPVKVVLYFFWLLKEVVVSSLTVSREILRPRMRCQPQVVAFSMPLVNPVARAILANSITLTPGTITLSVSDEGVFLVHALTDQMADSLLEGTMARKVAALYEETCAFVPLSARQPVPETKEGGVV